MVERNYHSVGVAHICGGVVGDETYARWPISNWLNSFLKLGEYKWREGRGPISLREHADAFNVYPLIRTDFTISCLKLVIWRIFKICTRLQV